MGARGINIPILQSSLLSNSVRDPHWLNQKPESRALPINLFLDRKHSERSQGWIRRTKRRYPVLSFVYPFAEMVLNIFGMKTRKREIKKLGLDHVQMV